MPTVARLLRLPMRTTTTEPWALGVRLADEPDGAQHLTIADGAPADGQRIDELAMLGEDAWISFVVRDHRLVPVRGESRLQAGDEVLVIASPERHDSITALFTGPASGEGSRT